MPVKIGGIDITKQMFELEYKVLVLDKIVTKILSKNPGLELMIKDELESIHGETVIQLKEKYPSLNIYKKL